MVLMPRQWLLKKLDPDNKFTVPALKMLLEDDMLEYKALIVNDWLDPRYDVKDVLRIYRKFNLITPAPKWGQIPLACTCNVCYPNCVCQCTILLASLFNPDIRVPAHYIGATVTLRKACRALKGAAG